MPLDEHDAAKALGGLGARHAGDGVAGGHVDDRLAGAELVGKDIEVEFGQLNGAAQALLKVFEAGARGRRGDRPHKGAVLGDKLARAVHAVRSGSERQVVEQQDVGALARGDGAAALRRAQVAMVEAEDVRGGERGHGDGDHRVDAGLDRHAAGVVDHADVEGVRGGAIVRGKAAATRERGVPQDERGEGGQVMAAGALAQHHVHAAGDLVERLLDARVLMVSDDARGGIGVEVVAGRHGGVPVHLAGYGLRTDRDATAGLLVSAVDAGQVHHLAQAEDGAAVLVHEGLHIGGGDLGARLLVGQGRDAGGHHELDVERRALGVLDHEREAVETAHVGDLVAVGDGGGGAPGKRHAGVLGRADVGALDVQVAVDETGGEVTVAAINDALRLPSGNGCVLAVAALEEHARDAAVLHRHLAAHHAQPIHVDDPRVREHHVRRNAPLRRVDESLHQADQIVFHL